MGKLKYPKGQLYIFRGTISAISATLRGVGRELEAVGAPQTVIAEVDGLATEVKALFECADNADSQSYEEDVYQHLYISTAFKIHLILQYATSIIAPSLALLTPSDQLSLKKVALLSEMQDIISAHLRHISAELNDEL